MQRTTHATHATITTVTSNNKSFLFWKSLKESHTGGFQFKEFVQAMADIGFEVGRGGGSMVVFRKEKCRLIFHNIHGRDTKISASQARTCWLKRIEKATGLDIEVDEEDL